MKLLLHLSVILLLNLVWFAACVTKTNPTISANNSFKERTELKRDQSKTTCFTESYAENFCQKRKYRGLFASPRVRDCTEYENNYLLNI